jgi:uncharacterized protein (DUF885 family)
MKTNSPILRNVPLMLLATWLAAAPMGAADAPDLSDLRQQTPGGLAEVVERFTQDLAGLERFHDAAISPARLERMKQFHSDWRDALEKLPFESLDRQAQIDYLLLKTRLEDELKQIEIQRERVAQMQPLIPFAAKIIEFHESRQRGESPDPAATASALSALTEDLQGLQQGFQSRLKSEPASVPDITQAPKTVVNRAARTVDDLRETLEEWFDHYNGYDPMFTWWTSQPYRDFDASLGRYASFLRQEVIGLKQGDNETIIGDPIGRDALLTELRREMIAYTPEELIEIARKELAWCDAEMLRASRDLGYGDDWHAALEHVKTLHVPPGEQPQLIRQQADEAVEFVKEFDLITVPSLAEEIWRVRMMSPERQLINPFFTGGEVISISFPTDGMSHEQKLMSMRGNNIHFSRATVHHELIPGHHLQQFMNARFRPYRRAFRTPFWTEGWSLYWELLLWDMNFAKTPEDRIGMLFWRMHRCARIIFSLNFHLGQMTAPEAVDFLVERVGHERANAAAEVRRSFETDYSPLYQAAYLLGGLQFRTLRHELVTAGNMSNKEFHDAVLKQGPMPVEMVRQALGAQPLTRDYTPNWKFYE